MDRWEPIETAPKNSEDELIGFYDGKVGFMRWDDRKTDYRYREGSEGYWMGFDCNDMNACEPTHWMPKPNPPKDLT